MMYLDLDEVDQVLAKSPFWSRQRFALAQFRRSDYFSLPCGDEKTPVNPTDRSIVASVQSAVHSALGFNPDGPVRLLTNLRYFGHVINPISCYYCFDASAGSLQALLIQVTNTPWGEKAHYVLDLRNHSFENSIDFNKCMHVSPFMPMNMVYRWRGAVPGEKLKYSLTNLCLADENSVVAGAGVAESVKYFDAGVNFNRIEITSASLNRILYQFPLMGLKVAAGIYWQALRLAIKRIPFVPHPGKDHADCPKNSATVDIPRQKADIGLCNTDPVTPTTRKGLTGKTAGIDINTGKPVNSSVVKQGNNRV